MLWQCCATLGCLGGRGWWWVLLGLVVGAEDGSPITTRVSLLCRCLEESSGMGGEWCSEILSHPLRPPKRRGLAILYYTVLYCTVL